MERMSYVIPDFVTAEEMKQIRKKLDVTQKELAELIHCSKSTVERWEMSEEPITGPVAFTLKLLEKHPEYVDEIRVPQKRYPLRLWYMYKQDVCTLIEVDEVGQKIHIKNYAEHLMFRAFGVNENPTQHTWTESPKPYAHMYIDDAAFGCPLIFNDEISPRGYVNWQIVESTLTGIYI